jgi:hypothetical protein
MLPLDSLDPAFPCTLLNSFICSSRKSVSTLWARANLREIGDVNKLRTASTRDVNAQKNQGKKRILISPKILEVVC